MESEKKQPKLVRIVVNATTYEWPKESITYAEIIQLAYPGEVVNESSTYKVSYRKKNGSTLTPLVYGSKPVEVKEDMVFNAASANRA